MFYAPQSRRDKEEAGTLPRAIPPGDTIGPQRGSHPELHPSPEEPRPSLLVSSCGVLGKVTPPLWRGANEKEKEKRNMLQNALSTMKSITNIETIMTQGAVLQSN